MSTLPTSAEPEKRERKTTSRDMLRYAKLADLSTSEFINQAIVYVTEQTTERVVAGESPQLYARLTPIIEIIHHAVKAIEEIEAVQS